MTDIFSLRETRRLVSHGPRSLRSRGLRSDSGRSDDQDERQRASPFQSSRDRTAPHAPRSSPADCDARWRCASRPSRALLAHADRRHRWTPAPRRALAAVPSTARPAADAVRGMSSAASGRCRERVSSAIGWGGLWRCAVAVRCLGGLKGAAGSNPPGRRKHTSEASARSESRSGRASGGFLAVFGAVLSR